MTTPDRPSPSDRPAPLTITIHARFDQWPVTIAYQGNPVQLETALNRLRDLGFVPAATAPTYTPSSVVEADEPLYQPDGTPCCPHHLRPLKHGPHGWYCSAKAGPNQPANAKGYCTFRHDA